MLPLIFNLGPTELIIILVILLLLFGGSRLAGLGKSSGRALKEFKEETKGLRTKDEPEPGTTTPDAAGYQQPQIAPYPPQQAGYGQPQQTPQVQPQDGYGQQAQPGGYAQQDPQGQAHPGTGYPSAPGSAEHPADRDQRRDV